jgi:transposase
MDAANCPNCRDLLEQIARLEARVAELQGQLDASRRAGKRQAAPFSKGPPKPNPKTPGRKAGAAHGRHAHRPAPSDTQIDAVYEAPLPDACPHCQGALVETEVAEQFQTELPEKPMRRKFRIHVGRCQHCGKRVQGRHPLQTSDALGAAASQVGPEAQAVATVLHTQLGLSHGKVAAVFQDVLGIDLTRGASAQINARVATRLEPDYHMILDTIEQSKYLSVDETGWRIGGKSAWLHVWVSDQVTAYLIDPRRSADALERVIGLDWDGVLSHDGWSPYDRFGEATHQQCLAHLLRRARDMLNDSRGGAVHFPRQVIDLFTEAIHLRNDCLRGLIPADQVVARRDEFDDRLLRLVGHRRHVAEHEVFAQHMARHFEQCFTFLSDPTIEATNWQAEQAIRPAVVNRKVCGGNRTPAGAQAQGILMSVLESCRRQAQSAIDHISQTLQAFGNRLLSRPILLATR